MKDLPSLARISAVLALAASPLSGAVILTDFSATHPMTLPFGGTTWAGPNQFQFFTDGAVQGQEVVPIGGGSPTVSGGAYCPGLTLDLTGQATLELTARTLALNQAVFVQVLLFDSDGTHARFSFATSNFNSSTFTSAYASLAGGVITVAGTTPGLNLGAITVYQIQGDFYDPGGAGNAPFRMQLDSLRAIEGVPEPDAASLVALAVLACLCGYRRRRKPAGIF